MVSSLNLLADYGGTGNLLERDCVQTADSSSSATCKAVHYHQKRTKSSIMVLKHIN